jgi:nucleotide-binding universal stress UspA family protein
MAKSSSKKKESGPGERNPILLKRILVPIDFSEYSKNALRYAVPFAKQFEAELLLMYVVEPTIYPSDFAFGPVTVPNLERELRERASSELERLVKTYIKGAVAVKTAIRTGKPSLEIIRWAKEETVDLIIIATHGHSGVEHVLFGSTTEKVVRKAPCPVLTLRSPEHEFIME